MKDGDGFHGTVLKVSEGGNIGYVDVIMKLCSCTAYFFKVFLF